MSRAEVWLGWLCLASLMVGTAVRAAITAVCAGSDVAGVRMVWTVWAGLVYISVFFGRIIIAAAARAGGTAPLMCSLTSGSVGVCRGLSTRGLALLVKLLLVLLSLSRWGAAVGSRAWWGSVGRIGLLATGWISISGGIIAGYSEPDFIAAAGDSVSATVPAAFVVGFEARFVLLRGTALPELQDGDGRPTAGLLVPLAAGGAQLWGRWRVRFTNLRTGLR